MLTEFLTAVNPTSNWEKKNNKKYNLYLIISFILSFSSKKIYFFISILNKKIFLYNLIILFNKKN